MREYRQKIIDMYNGLVKTTKSVTPVPVFTGINSSREASYILDPDFHRDPWIRGFPGMTRQPIFHLSGIFKSLN